MENSCRSQDHVSRTHICLPFVDNGNKVIMLGGDFNLPDIDWTIPTIKNQCTTPAIHNQLLNTLADHSLTQLKDAKTIRCALQENTQ